MCLEDLIVDRQGHLHAEVNGELVDELVEAGHSCLGVVVEGEADLVD